MGYADDPATRCVPNTAWEEWAVSDDPKEELDLQRIRRARRMAIEMDGHEDINQVTYFAGCLAGPRDGCFRLSRKILQQTRREVTVP